MDKPLFSHCFLPDAKHYRTRLYIKFFMMLLCVRVASILFIVTVTVCSFLTGNSSECSSCCCNPCLFIPAHKSGWMPWNYTLETNSLHPHYFFTNSLWQPTSHCQLPTAAVELLPESCCSLLGSHTAAIQFTNQKQFKLDAWPKRVVGILTKDKF